MRLRVSRKLIVRIFIPIILLGLAIGWFSINRYKHLQARAAWKTSALERLASQSLDNEIISEELETLKASRGAGSSQNWIGENVLMMSNNEYLVYASRHGSSREFVDHLFLAHGSDGHWYYSSYHFCNSMVMLMSDEPPGSIVDFVSRYAAREFDGKSDVCLQSTWFKKP